MNIFSAVILNGVLVVFVLPKIISLIRNFIKRNGIIATVMGIVSVFCCFISIYAIMLDFSIATISFAKHGIELSLFSTFSKAEWIALIGGALCALLHCVFSKLHIQFLKNTEIEEKPITQKVEDNMKTKKAIIKGGNL